MKKLKEAKNYAQGRKEVPRKNYFSSKEPRFPKNQTFGGQSTQTHR